MLSVMPSLRSPSLFTMLVCPQKPLRNTRTVAQWDYLPNDNAAFLKFHLRFKSGLRKAGMPER